MIQTQLDKQRRKNKVSEARNMAGSATYEQSKQYEVVLSLKVSLFIQA